MEQRVNVKLCVKLGKSPTETYNLLKELYGDGCLSRSRIFNWFKKFKEGREVIEDDPRPGRPRTSRTEANIKNVGEIVQRNPNLGIRAVAKLSNLDRETVRQILHQNFNVTKICSKIVTRPDMKHKFKESFTESDMFTLSNT